MCHYFLLKAEIRASGQLHLLFIPKISPISNEECWTEWMFQRVLSPGICACLQVQHFFDLDVQKQLRIFDICFLECSVGNRLKDFAP